MRKPFQGVFNIVRFNWHFYLVAIGIVLIAFVVSNAFFPRISIYLNAILIFAIASILVSLLVSFYVYDLSNLYELDWLDRFDFENKETIANINAGFDETSVLLDEKFHPKELIVLDFYDAAKHTEVSIKRARKAYPPHPKTKSISTSKIGLEENSIDKVFLILSAHEIRNDSERTDFFRNISLALKPNGKIIVTEHLRDLPNLLAYNLGAFHFHSRISWLKNFQDAKLSLLNEINITPFITTFVLKKNGTSS